MDETRELKFRKAINTLTKSDKSLIIMLDGNKDSLRKDMVDKLIDRIEPSRYELYKYDKKHFNIAEFWSKGAHKHKIIVWDGSYKQDLDLCNKEELQEIDFFEKQMLRYGFYISAFKFVNDKKVTSEYKNKYNYIKVEGSDKDIVFDLLIDTLTTQIENLLKSKDFNTEPIQHITSKPLIDLTKIKNEYDYDEETWKKLQDKYQKKIRKLHEKMIDKGKSLAIVFQGIDGAGKSSTIRRITSKMCPHWYSVYGIQAPSQEELNHHHLWRFWNKLPKPGEITIFDRSWYERLTAERVLKLNGNGWVYGVDEIKEFEKELENNNIHVVKFWFNIDKDTQGARFKERENNPLKTWKISKADYQTREKWDEYVPVFSEMLTATNYEFCPWHLIDSRNKREARIEVMKILIKEMKKCLKKKK